MHQHGCSNQLPGCGEHDPGYRHHLTSCSTPVEAEYILWKEDWGRCSVHGWTLRHSYQRRAAAVRRSLGHESESDMAVRSAGPLVCNRIALHSDLRLHASPRRTHEEVVQRDDCEQILLVLRFGGSCQAKTKHFVLQRCQEVFQE